MTDIRINAPGAGDWIMDRVGGVFTPIYDQSFSRHDKETGQIRGGFVLARYLGACMTVHMAGADKRWCNRELLWLTFHYAFHQAGCTKLLSPMRSDDNRSLPMQIRAGWSLETVITDVYAPGIHMLVLSMTRDTCPWLKYQPKEWRSNREAA